MADKVREERAVETLLNNVHKNHISLQDEEIKRNVEHFNKVCACSEASFFIDVYIVTNTEVDLVGSL
jgi:hypothetical protein